MKLWHKVSMVIGAALISPLAQAHDQQLSAGFYAGFIHPLTGVDHLAALVMAGLLIGRMASSRGLALGGMVAALTIGFSAAILIGSQAWVEAAVLLSVPVFLGLQWIRQPGGMKVAVAMMGLFMITHGWAHGTTLVAMNSGFIFGVLLASAVVMGLSSQLSLLLRTGNTTTGHA